MELKENLLSLMKSRKDKEALKIIQENPDLRDNTVCHYALDNRCFSCIAYLRENGYITLAGRAEREEARLKDIEDHLETYYNLLEEVRKHADI